MSSPGTDGWTLGVIVGLAVITVITRSFFFISSQSWNLPRWAQRGLQYAPIAALSAVIVPEIVMTQGELISTWQDARPYAAVAGAAFFLWQAPSATHVSPATPSHNQRLEIRGACAMPSSDF